MDHTMTDSAQSLNDLDQVLVERGFPAEDLDELLRYAQGEFDKGLDHHPDGDNWSGGDPVAFADGVDYNAMEAVLRAEGGEFVESKRGLGDSLNYLLFLWSVIGRMEDEDGD